MTKPPELKPCPFCGGEAEWKSGGPGCAWVSCKDCPAETGDGTIDRVKKSWNTRTPDPAALVEAARPFADIGVSQNPDWQPMIRLDRDAILALRAALAAFDKTTPETKGE